MGCGDTRTDGQGLGLASGGGGSVGSDWGGGLLTWAWLGWGEVGCSADVGFLGMRSRWIGPSSLHSHLIGGAFRPGRRRREICTRRESAFDLLMFGFMRSFVCALSAAF